MELLHGPLRESAEYEEMQKTLNAQGGSIAVFGCAESQKLHLISALGKDYDVRLIVTHGAMRAQEIATDYALYDKNVFYFPSKDLIFYQADLCGNQVTTRRMKVIREILEGKRITIVMTAGALLAPMLPLEVYQNHILHLQKGAVAEEGALRIRLTTLGYECVHKVEEPGQFSVRGGIIDVFDLTQENPIRIELWGDEVDSIRSFDVQSQRSIEKLRSISIYPATELLLDSGRLSEGLKQMEADTKKNCDALRKRFETEAAHRLQRTFDELKEEMEEFGIRPNLDSYFRYFYPDAPDFTALFAGREMAVFVDEPGKTDMHMNAVEKEFRESMMHRSEKGYVLPGQMGLLVRAEEVYAKLSAFPCAYLSILDHGKLEVSTQQTFHLNVHSVSPYNGSVTELMRDLKRFKKEGYRVLVVSGSRTRAKRLAEDITQEGVHAVYTENAEREFQPGEVLTFYGALRQGFEYPLLRLVVLSDTDIFGAQRKKKKKTKTYAGQKIESFGELNVGDYVVHENYGLGIYRGIDKITTDGVTKDYMKIEYRDNSNLYVLATAFDMVQKYASADAKKPKLNKLGSKEWSNTKAKVRAAVDTVAKDLVELYAKRRENIGFRYSKDTIWQKEFEELFPFEETQDQLAAIEATKADMESSKVMERLICGDVGYGKTEIAIRAAFKAVMDSKQVAYLAPTTVLAQQHYNTFTERMKDYPIKIELLSRYRTPTQIKKTVERIRKGLVDIVIGTHRVLSDDVNFKDLGLLIIDEEQRFGVAHKEKMKKLRESVDVLTLTATPIPRTLHMSLVGIRDMSLLTEAPQDRLPIQTFVMEQDDEMIREAIVRELTRGGQVFYVHNRINDISDVAFKVEQLVPEANVAYAHGQMKESDLENIMYEFVSGETDVLVSTTIIETGLDISNVNTIIIDGSERLGLSQLYQLRGRVGRSNKMAYAFLMYSRNKMLKEEAEKRLQAIREFTELGSGFKISMRDLEIRGAGNILGMRQHGHMEAVGYELYCKMLNEAVALLKGETVRADFETVAELDVDAFIPAEYIVNEEQKLEIYHRIAAIEGKADYDEMQDELLDRFGAIPKSAAHLLRIALLRATAHRMYVTEIKGKAGEIKISMKSDAPVKIENMENFLKGYGASLKFVTAGNPGFVLTYPKHGLVEKDEILILEKTEQLLLDMEVLI